MAKISMEIKNCSECPNCYSERFYTADSFEHESNYYCRLFEGYDKYPKTDHYTEYLVSVQNKPGVIELFADWGITVGVPKWCPIKV